MRLNLGKTVPFHVREILSQPIKLGQPVVSAGLGEGIDALEDRLVQSRKPRGQNLSDLQLEDTIAGIQEEIHRPGGSDDEGDGPVSPYTLTLESIDVEVAAEVAEKQTPEPQQ